MEIVKYMQDHGHEQLVVCSEPSVRLRALVAIHDTTLGPAVGGLRIWPYASESDAMMDALRLSRAMTYKAAAADLPLGGGKAVIMADPQSEKTESLLRAFARHVDTLGGRYVTTTDVGSTIRDLEYIATETRHVAGLPTSLGGSGDTAVLTGLGVYLGMKACAKEAWGSDSLSGRTVAIQGFGKVGYQTAEHLLKEGAGLIVTDAYEGPLEKARELGAAVVGPEEIYDVGCDIFAPCALGGVLNRRTIPRLRCSIVAGSANNQLLDDQDGVALHRKGILYAPDYIINAGGLINIAAEMEGPYSPERAKERTERIYQTMQRVLDISSRDEIPTYLAADKLAEARLRSVREVRRLFRPWGDGHGNRAA
jgi:leucine dehydrogenase